MTATGAWQVVAGTTTRIPLGIAAVAMRLVAAKPVTQPSLPAQFDDVLVTPSTVQ